MKLRELRARHVAICRVLTSGLKITGHGRMLRNLKRAGCVLEQRDGSLALTDKGKAVAVAGRKFGWQVARRLRR